MLSFILNVTDAAYQQKRAWRRSTGRFSFFPAHRKRETIPAAWARERQVLEEQLFESRVMVGS